jgi:hypothetical protein
MMRYDPGVVTRVRPGAHGGAGRGGGGAQILVGGAGRGVQVCAPVRPCQSCPSESHHGHFESSPGQSEYILSQSESIFSQSKSLQEISSHCPIRHRDASPPPRGVAGKTDGDIFFSFAFRCLDLASKLKWLTFCAPKSRYCYYYCDFNFLS